MNGDQRGFPFVFGIPAPPLGVPVPVLVLSVYRYRQCRRRREPGVLPGPAGNPKGPAKSTSEVDWRRGFPAVGRYSDWE